MNYLPFALLLVASSRPLMADCLEISEQRFEPQSAEFGALEVQWKAQIENRCRTGLDADLTVHFRDAAGESVYEVRDRANLRAHQTLEIGKRAYVPNRFADTIADVDIQAEERKDPL